MEEFYSIRWVNQTVRMLDQRLLPEQIVYHDFLTVEEIAQAIKDMIIRGAPAIGSAAAYGLALAVININTDNAQILKQELSRAASKLLQSRPTAVNINKSVERIIKITQKLEITDEIRKRVILEAHLIAKEDVEANRQMGINAFPLIPVRANIIHHCNTGALATVGYGTALGVIRTAHELGKIIHVYVDETRPRFQGSRLTAWELDQLAIPYTIIVDGASGYFMRSRNIDLCLVGCDRIAANGDVANKIGTYNLALVAYNHRIPFYVVGPTSSIDMDTQTGDEISIEERDENEITRIGEYRITFEGANVANPAFDITPAKYISAIITERGIVYPPYQQNLAELLDN
jgi:methylthioribose-1-phosphate isomerase